MTILEISLEMNYTHQLIFDKRNKWTSMGERGEGGAEKQPNPHLVPLIKINSRHSFWKHETEALPPIHSAEHN